MKGNKPAGPSATELKMRSDLDRARRELEKVRKAGAAGGDAEGLNTQVQALTVQVASLTAQVTELTDTRKRLARLYFTQVEDGRRRAARVQRVGEALRRLTDMAPEVFPQQLATLVHEGLGFAEALVRVREGESLEPRGVAGPRAVAGALVADEARRALPAQARTGHAERVRAGTLHSDAPAPAAGQAWEWQEGDALWVPWFDDDGTLVALVVAGCPEGGVAPSPEAMALLELAVAHAFGARERQRLATALADSRRALDGAAAHAQELHALKSQFVATVSHELRTPLTAIRACVDTLLAGAGGLAPDKLEQLVTMMDQETSRLGRLIESVLDLHRLEAADTPGSRMFVDVGALAAEVERLLAPVAEAGQITLKLLRTTADTRVEGDRDQLRQLLMHLGGNALKFTPAGGTVTVRVEANPREVRLQVEDTGIGIPAEALDRVFERFYQVDGSTVRRHGGSGLGLAICKGIVETHGGRIVAASTPGAGSCFAAVLPRGPHVHPAVRPVPASRPHADDLMRLSVEMVAEVMNARVVSLMAPGSNGELYVRAAVGLEEAVVRAARARRGEGVAGWVAEHRRPQCVGAGPLSADVSPSGRPTYQSGTFLSVPLEGRDGLLGVLNVTDPRNGRTFQIEDCHLLLHLARTISMAWDAMWESTGPTDALVDAADAMRRLAEHVGADPERTRPRMELARRLAAALGCDEEQVGATVFAAAVHDVGMADAAGAVEGKPRVLGAAEREAMQRHPELGAALLAPLDRVDAVRAIVRAHHEWWDGTGYPCGIAGEAIPIGARVLAVVDAWESMTAGRAFRAARSAAEARGELRALAGRQFDPAVVGASEQVLDAEPAAAARADGTEPAAQTIARR